MKKIVEMDGPYMVSKVVMLPTNDISAEICKIISTNLLRYKSDDLVHHTNQHLYIISNEEIKEGDWFYSDEFSLPEQAKVFENNLINGFIKSACKKIIATTDGSLKIPQIPKEFILFFIKAYNNGKIIENILVGQYSYGFWTGSDTEGNQEYHQGEYKTKIVDNTIIIKNNDKEWDAIKSSLYVGEGMMDKNIDYAIDCLIQLGYTPPVKQVYNF